MKTFKELKEYIYRTDRPWKGEAIKINVKYRTKDQIRARLTIYGHEEMSDKEFKFFKKWLTIVIPQTAKNKRGELSKIFRQTLYKN